MYDLDKPDESCHEACCKHLQNKSSSTIHAAVHHVPINANNSRMDRYVCTGVIPWAISSARRSPNTFGSGWIRAMCGRGWSMNIHANLTLSYFMLTSNPTVKVLYIPASWLCNITHKIATWWELSIDEFTSALDNSLVFKQVDINLLSAVNLLKKSRLHLQKDSVAKSEV